MSLSTQLLYTINRIAEELSPEECKRLLYLCGELHTQQYTTNVREMLQSRMGQVNTDQAFLMELMLRMRRYDLLSGVLGISKSEAERILKDGHALSDYRYVECHRYHQTHCKAPTYYIIYQKQIMRNTKGASIMDCKVYNIF